MNKIICENIDSVEQEKSEVSNVRRTFMKKVAYVAPTLIGLGSLTRPTDAKAGFGKPPSGPTWP